MKILIVSIRGPTNADRRGGAQDYIRFVSAPWVQQGHAVTILCAQEKFGDVLLPDNELVDGIEVVRTGTPSARFFPLRAMTADLAKDYDVVVENIMGFPLFLPPVTRHVPLVALKHHFEGPAFMRTQGVFKGLFGMFLENIMQPLLYRHIPFVVVSELTRNMLYSRWLTPTADVSIVPPGIHEVRIPEAVSRAERPTVIYYGALDTGRKRVDHLIQAFRHVAEIVPDARLVIGGKGPDETALREQAAGLDIEFRGFLSEQQKLELLGEGWVFASPSMTEGFGITWVEANSAGLPVVVYELGLDTVSDDCSIGVPLGNIKELGDALVRLLSDEELRIRMVEPAKQNAARFNWESSSQRFLEFLQAVSGRAGTGAR